MIRLSVLSSCMVLLVIAFLDNDNHVHGQNIITKEFQRERKTRAYFNAVSVVRKGIQYVKSLLVGAKRVDQGTTNSKIFHKTGGIDKLKKDFYRFSPTEIRGFPLENGGTGKAAKLADRIMIYKSQGDAGVPQLEIYMAKDINAKKATGKAFSELDREIIRYLE